MASIKKAVNQAQEALREAPLKDDLWRQHKIELSLRKRYPTLQNAWEQYQTMLKLVSKK